MIVFGVDPGTTFTGVGIVERTSYNRARYLFSARIKCNPKDVLHQKLKTIYTHLDTVLQRFKPDHCVIEQVFVAKNVHAALVLGQARGVALLALSQHCTNISALSPKTIKKIITGSGSASKEQIQYMVKQHLHLEQTPSIDAADALAMALTHALQLNKEQCL
jgi:crossover junction endodeoxyribonuclease RuvC